MESFSVLISKMVNIDKYNPHKQKLVGILSNFLEYQWGSERKSENC